MKRIALLGLVFICALGSEGCDGGLSPVSSEKPGISGTITYEMGSWPSPDSLANTRLYVFASQVYPLDSAGIFSGLVSIPPRIFLTPSFGETLPLAVDQTPYDFDLPPADYPYVGVLQFYGNDLVISAFQVVGVYHDLNDPLTPKTVRVESTGRTRGIDIAVDFNHPPPQPF